MRAIGIDLGAVRVGLAISDELGLLAHPRPHLKGGDLGRLVGELVRLAEQEHVEVFVVGLPRTLTVREGAPARRARRFAQMLERASGRRVELYDEWFTTREAENRLRAQGLSERELRSRIDSAAASILLQSWLDRRGSSEA
jgi:putative Holliday junction resolvase